MTGTTAPRFSVDEVRGRLLAEQLQCEALAELARYQWLPTATPPPIPHVGTTDTGTMRAVVVAV